MIQETFAASKNVEVVVMEGKQTITKYISINSKSLFFSRGYTWKQPQS